MNYPSIKRDLAVPLNVRLCLNSEILPGVTLIFKLLGVLKSGTGKGFLHFDTGF